MNEKVNIDLNTLKFVYERYKDFIIPFVVVVLSLIVFVALTMPQIKNLLKIREEVKIAKEELNRLKEKLNTLSSIDSAVLDSQLQVVNAALPVAKDFSGILGAISFASDATGVSVGDFVLQIGNLGEGQGASGLPAVSLNLSVSGSTTQVSDFINKLSQTLPLSEVTSVSLGNTSSNVNVSFYYKQVQDTTINASSSVDPVSGDGASLINRLSTFVSNKASENISIPEQPFPPSSPAPSSEEEPFPFEDTTSTNPFE